MSHHNQQILFQVKNHLVETAAELMVSTEDNKTFISAQTTQAALEKNQLQRILRGHKEILSAHEAILSDNFPTENVSPNVQMANAYKHFMLDTPVPGVPEAMQPGPRALRVHLATRGIHDRMLQPR